MPGTYSPYAKIMSALNSINSLQNPTPGNPFNSTKKVAEALVKLSDILNTALCHKSPTMVNDLENNLPQHKLLMPTS